MQQLAIQMTEEQAKKTLASKEFVSHYSDALKQNQQGKGKSFRVYLAELKGEPTSLEAVAAAKPTAGKPMTYGEYVAANPDYESDPIKAKIAIDLLKAENQALREGKVQTNNVSLKVSAKGGLSVYGLGRFPVTLYREQWNKLLSMTDQIRKFMADNTDKLRAKGQ